MAVGLAAEFYIKIAFIRVTLAKELLGGVPKNCTKGVPACPPAECTWVAPAGGCCGAAC